MDLSKLTEIERSYFIGWLDGVLEYLGYSMTKERKVSFEFRKEIIDAILQSIAQGKTSLVEQHKLMDNVKIHLLLAQAIATGTLNNKMSKWTGLKQ